MVSESSRELYLSGHDVDSKKQLKIQRMLAFFEDVAEENAAKNGFGQKCLIEKGAAWVLTQSETRIYDYPRLGVKYILKTWPCKLRKVFADRGYQIIDAKNPEKILVESMSTWVMMDLETRNLVIPSDVGIDMPDYPDESTIFKISRKKIRDIEPNITKEICPVYSDYDVNAHVNNTKYLEWICNFLPINKVRDVGFELINITYKKEIRENQKVIVDIKDDEEGFVAIGKDEEGTQYFECFGKYKEVK